jgi:hypothetical protein
MVPSMTTGRLVARRTATLSAFGRGHRQLTAFARHPWLTTDDGHMLGIARSYQDIP